MRSLWRRQGFGKPVSIYVKNGAAHIPSNPHQHIIREQQNQLHHCTIDYFDVARSNFWRRLIQP